jgi:hypothetical protein
MPLRAFVTFVIMTVDNNARYPIKICGSAGIWHCYPQTVQADPPLLSEGYARCLQLWITQLFRCLSAVLLPEKFFHFLRIAQNLKLLLWGRYLQDRMFCNDLKSLHEHTVLICRDLKCFLPGSWPVEGTVVKALIQEQESIAFPEESFDPVIPLPTKQIKCIFIVWIKMELEPDDVCQPFQAPPQI